MAFTFRADQTAIPAGKKRTMKTSSAPVINHPAERANLARWNSTPSDREYQACSRAHRAAGTFREGGRSGWSMFESIGGNLLVQHYLAEKLAADQVVMHSKNSRVYVSHLVRATIEVIWTLDAKPRDGQSTLFSCSVETRMAPLLSVLSTVALLPFFLRRHTQEETLGFAADISRKLSKAFLKSQPEQFLSVAAGAGSLRPNVSPAQMNDGEHRKSALRGEGAWHPDSRRGTPGLPWHTGEHGTELR